MPAKIAVRDVSKSFPSDKGQLHVVDRVSLALPTLDFWLPKSAARQA